MPSLGPKPDRILVHTDDGNAFHRAIEAKWGEAHLAWPQRLPSGARFAFGRAMEKLVITVAPTGSVPRKKDSPHVPVTPDEIAETAYLCEQVGASIIHVHCRDENERPTSRFEIFRETVDKIRRRTKLIVMTSTSGIAGTTDADRAAPLKTKPEVGSLTTGTLNFAGRKPAVVYVNTPETVQFLAKAMLDQN